MNKNKNSKNSQIKYQHPNGTIKIYIQNHPINSEITITSENILIIVNNIKISKNTKKIKTNIKISNNTKTVK